MEAINNIFKNKWLALGAFFVFFALSAERIEFIRMLHGTSPTFFETIAEQLNEMQMILFPLMYVFLMFTIDNNVDMENGKIPYMLLKNAFYQHYSILAFSFWRI